MNVDGNDLRALLPGFSPRFERVFCCSWIPDAKFFLFSAKGQIWALPRKSGFLRSVPEPVALTSSPMALDTPVPSRDGKKLFVVGRTFRGELLRYVAKSSNFAPFLGGISGEFVDFSKDGQWVAYTSFPDGVLWRCKSDRTGCFQLTYKQGYVVNPRWAPGRKTIVFFGMGNDGKSRIWCSRESKDSLVRNWARPDGVHVYRTLTCCSRSNIGWRTFRHDRAQIHSGSGG
jgi:WD40 repeat protein